MLRSSPPTCYFVAMELGARNWWIFSLLVMLLGDFQIAVVARSNRLVLRNTELESSVHMKERETK